METEKVSKFARLLKNKIILVIIGLIILSSIMYGIGNNNAKVALGKKLVTYDELNKEIKTTDKKLSNKKDEYRNTFISLDNQIAGKEKEVTAALDALKQKDSIDAQIQKLNGDLSSLNQTIQSKQSELDSLNNQIKAKNEAPVQLPAGQFLVGKDIKAGRYKVVAVGRGSNFKVFNSSGQNLVNTIIYSDNSDGLGVSEYVTVLSDGDMIDASSAFKYIPVQ
jgi:hypothetical protein